ITGALNQVPDKGLADAVAQHHEPLDAEMVHQADMVIGEGIPRPVDLQRTGGLAGVGVAQVGADAAQAVLEFLHGIEGMGGVEAGDRRVQATARDDQQGEACAHLLVVDADFASFIDRHDGSSCYLMKGQPPSLSGRNASVPGTVATILTRSHSPFDSSGALACIRYISRTTRPSSRTLPFLVMKSLIGIFRISAMTALASSVPAALTAFR